MAHGYYNLQGDFVETATLAAATAAWREERGYEPLGVFDMGDRVVDTREEDPSPTTPAPAPAVPSPTTDRALSETYATGTSGDVPYPTTDRALNATTSSTTPLTDQLVRATSGYVGESGRQVSEATPTEQAAAQGGGVPTHIDPYFADLSSGMQYLYSQWPYNVGGVGTPTELRAGGGYGPSSYQWSESPESLAALAQGQTPVGPALAAADTVATFLTEFGVRPEFVTSFVTQSLGLTPSDMTSMGYVQDLYGRWIALDFGEEELVGGGVGVAGTGGYSTGGGLGSYSSPAGFRSGYTSGLINWRIGF